jgi:hypothetical protein
VFGAGVFAYLVVWAALKPPLQAPDEHAHLIKAYSMPAAPWVARRAEDDVPGRLWNPLCELPDGIAGLFFHPDRSFSEDDVARLKRAEWPWREWTPHTWFTQAWSYPPLFYWTALLTGQGLTEGLRLPPYQSLFAWRIAVALVAAALWAWVLHALTVVGGLERAAPWLALAMVANPMLAFISSSVNPDAVHIPLVTLAIVYSFLYLRDGTHGRTLLVMMLLAALTKPAVWLMIAAMGCGVVAFASLRCIGWRDAWAWGRVAGLAAAISWFGFYAWSPPRLYGYPRPDTDLGEYLAHLQEVAFVRWTEYWGRLGWLDYQADPAWYGGLLAAFAMGLALVVRQLPDWRRTGAFPLFALLFGVAYLAGTVAGEFLYLPIAGFTLQGRYLLPASLAFSIVLLGQGRGWRYAAAGGLLALNVVLVQQTVQRYYDGSWTRLWQAQAFTGPREPASATSGPGSSGARGGPGSGSF